MFVNIETVYFRHELVSLQSCLQEAASLPRLLDLHRYLDTSDCHDWRHIRSNIVSRFQNQAQAVPMALADEAT
jgi:hypothetical protein